MKENYLVLKIMKNKIYNSIWEKLQWQLKILLTGFFYSNRPNYKMIIDINEFLIATEKVHFPSVIDCFDEMVFVWIVDTNPNAELVNSMLDKYFETLMNGEKLSYKVVEDHIIAGQNGLIE